MKNKMLYLECESGISGDMFAAAMLDLGADEKALTRALDSVPVKGFTFKVSRVLKSGIDCCDFDVILDEAHENHDHDMAYLYGHEHAYEHDHEHDHEHHHDHEHTHAHLENETPHMHNHHEHRHLSDILSIIDRTDMTDSAKKLAGKIFRIIAEAEAKAHHLPIEEVHFHEVGAVDSIVDVISAAVLFDSLDVSEVIIDSISEGRGTVRCQHGILPVPVPATVNIAETYGLPLHFMDNRGEFVTPTGAAIAAAIRTGGELPETFAVKKTGLGAGKRSYTERPGILRALLIKNAGVEDEDRVVKLETDIDDATGEMLGHAMKKLLKAGALDVHYTPIYMKKNRPGFELTVICQSQRMKDMEAILFQETTTIGIRKFPAVRRSLLNRTKKQVQTRYGMVNVKWVEGNGIARAIPEYESVRERAEKEKVPFVDVYMAASGKTKKELL
ncbi:MAG: nickel pincer cofactor biosynthesis protein LarC [Dialister sp.]|nr:nickel pincer cofactor biosynthesis protein LarC [Dialister sp.]